MPRDWQGIFQKGQDLAPQALTQLQSLEVDIASLLAFENGGSLAALRQSNALTNVTADVSSLIVHVGTAITVPTGYASNDIVEPSVLYDPAAPFGANASGTGGYEYVMLADPYPSSDDAFENPSLWVSHDGTTWYQVVFTAGLGVVNTGAAVTTTPVIATLVQGDGKNSDGHLYRGPDGTYYITWNQFLVATGSGGTGTGGKDWSTKMVKAASILGPWSTPVTIISEIKATTRVTSPSIFWDGTTWHLYAVDTANTSATAIIHYATTSTDPTTGGWAKLSNPTIALPTGYTGQVWWHLNAYLWGSMHILIVQDSLAGASGAGNLWALSSTDQGVTWTVPALPMLNGAQYYRAACVFSNVGAETALDIWYGFLTGGHWSFRRGLGSFGIYKYGGVNPYGSPIEALLISAARVPIAPYVFGDAPKRADSAATPSPADSGQTYTVSQGTAGISTNALYAAVQPCKATLALTGCADGVTTAEFTVLDTPNQTWLICRFVDASNYVRIGYNNATSWQIQNIVAGSVTQAVVFSDAPPIAAGDFLAIVHKGTTITIYVNGRKMGQVTGYTNNAAGSGIGYQTTSTTARFKNLSARPLVQGF